MKDTAILITLALVCLAGHAAGNSILTCHSCEGAQCQRSSLHKEQKCVDSLDYCVTVFAEAEVLFKGCSLEIPNALRARSPDSHSIHKCNTDRCNTVGSAKHACIQCDSSKVMAAGIMSLGTFLNLLYSVKDSNCDQNAAALEAARCAAPTAPNSYCYVKTSGSTTLRGCATTESDQQSCLGDANCLLCSPGDIWNCNAVNISATTTLGNRFTRFLR
ncbi:Hypothetical predicted protein [Drosophila guanche]|uniref:DUF753 domain-containing protein n=1 Tax=Drosophila guanche TaxID=7266 RepID=A0A3B0JWF2_DROGU|nr:Hypothetical predicted protein [Drosophila guanche]